MILRVQVQEAADKLQCNTVCKQELTGQLLLMDCLLLFESISEQLWQKVFWEGKKNWLVVLYYKTFGFCLLYLWTALLYFV